MCCGGIQKGQLSDKFQPDPPIKVPDSIVMAQMFDDVITKQSYWLQHLLSTRGQYKQKGPLWNRFS